jgi:hypothetical protein
MSQKRVGTDLRAHRAINAVRATLQFFSATTFAVLLSVLLGACQPSATQPAAQQANIGGTPAQATLAATEASAPESIGVHFKEGMAYADLRKLVIDAGWQPVVDAECKSNVAGRDHAVLCKSDPGLGSCTICDHLPELAACSGDAYCGMHFSNGVQRLHVVTYGDFGDWNVSGDQSQLSVHGWDFSKR